MILALQLIVQATAPLTQAAGVKVLLSQLSGDALLDVLLGALLSVLCYSSLAVVLLTAALAASNVSRFRSRWRWCLAPTSAAACRRGDNA